MTNILKTTKQIHDTIDKINQKYGLEIDIESDNVIYQTGKINVDGSAVINKAKIDYCECYISETGELMRLSSNNFVAFTLAKDWQYEIGEYQIKQILIALKDVLGEDDISKQLKVYAEKWLKIGGRNAGKHTELLYERWYSLPKTVAEALCKKWLDGLNPLFDSDREKVLEELLEILQNLGLLKVLNNLIK
jgi:hypothetical protein